MNTTPCLICGEQDSTNLVEAPDFEYACKPGTFKVARCNVCGHVFANPTPAPNQIPALYPPTYYTVNPRSPLYLRGTIYRAKLRGDARRMHKATEGRNTQSILDIGCGDAERLSKLRKRRGGIGLTLAGIDLLVSDYARTRCVEHDIDLFQGNIESAPDALANRRFDLILMAQLIEHLCDPRNAITNAARLLNPGGRLLIETPNLGGLDYHLFKDRYWGGYHIPRHLHLFTHKSLARLVKSCGLQVLKQGSLPSPGFWIISLRNRLGLNSAYKTNSHHEWINFSNPLPVLFFTALDLLTRACGIPTSNQYLLARKPKQYPLAKAPRLL